MSRLAAWAGLLLAAGAPACHRVSEADGGGAGRAATDTAAAATVGRSEGAPGIATDTARGVVVLSGNEPGASLVLRRDADGPLALGGDAARALHAVAGLEVMVRGRLTTERVATAAPGGAPLFRASAFVVRAADGVAVHDGVVASRDGAYLLRLTEGGERPAPHLPAPLRAQVGARVYLAGPLDRAPQAYGVVAPAR